MSQKSQLLQSINEVEAQLLNEQWMYAIHKRYFALIFTKNKMLFDGLFLSFFMAGWFFEKHHGLRNKLQRGVKLLGLAALNSVRKRFLLN